MVRYEDDDFDYEPNEEQPFYRPSSRLDAHWRQQAEEENRKRGEPPKDWNDRQEVRRFINFHLEDNLRRKLQDVFRGLLHRSEITVDQAIKLIDEIPWEQDRVYMSCVKVLENQLASHDDEGDKSDTLHDMRIAVMNNPRLWAAMTKEGFWFRRIRTAVLERGDFRRLGVTWTNYGNHLDDRKAAWSFLEKAVFTHALECIQDMGDEMTGKADAFLFERIERGIGPDPDTSEKTAEFLGGCLLLATGELPPEEKVKLASEMIILLVGRQSRRDREIGADESVRPAHQGLRTLNYLLNVIFAQMTEANAGTMLRWAMGRHRHHKWVWERIVAEVKRYHWRIEKVQEFPNGEIGVGWWLRERQTAVIPPEDAPDKFDPGTIVLVPPKSQLGEIVDRGDDWTLYRAPLQPLRPY